MNYPELKIDEEKCIHCGKCIQDCIVNCLEMAEENFVPKFKQYKEGTCIKCQHCLAVCPTGALSIWGKNPNESDVKRDINSEEVLNLIKNRRSVRQYKPVNIDKERLNKLKDMLKWPPTGVNNHKLHFSFIDDIEVMDDIRNKVNPKVIKLLDNKFIKKTFPHFNGISDAIRNGKDIIFRSAPHMLVVSTPVNAPCSVEDPIISLSYFELYANSMGIGTLWCGFAYYCFKMIPELSDYIGVPDGYKVSYAMLFGEPDIKYMRATQPDSIEIKSVPLGGLKQSNWLRKTKHAIHNWLR